MKTLTIELAPICANKNNLGREGKSDPFPVASGREPGAIIGLLASKLFARVLC